MATLTYVYADQQAVLGPLAPDHVPGSYDLCREHCDQLSAPRGWEVIRLEGIAPDPIAAVVGDPVPLPVAGPADDLLALADAVREVGLGPDELDPRDQRLDEGAEVVVLAERRHLRVVPDESDRD